jgi:hypothetical protein
MNLSIIANISFSSDQNQGHICSKGTLAEREDSVHLTSLLRYLPNKSIFIIANISFSSDQNQGHICSKGTKIGTA